MTLGRKPDNYIYYRASDRATYYALAADHSYFWMSMRRKWVKSWVDTDQAIREELQQAGTNPLPGLPEDVLPILEQHISGT